MTDRLDRVLDISFQVQFVSLGTRRYPLVPENHFLSHRWTHLKFCSRVLPNKNQGHSIVHCSFADQSVKASKMLLHRAGETGTDI